MEPIADIIRYFFLSLLFGAIFWIPTILFTLILEGALISEKTTGKQIGHILFAEGIACFCIIWAILGGVRLDYELAASLLFCITIPQLLRWWFLKHKGRMYQSALNTEEIDQHKI